ncbi:hypothetical protein [Streptomyces sp. NPDC050287]|uniref:hypothetical protein n=1 Tax=Streptomyces sp. NPDC050287 TaxID=3365608 RepID=UPI003787CC92
MARPPQYDNGANGAPDATRESDESPGWPDIYLPQVESAPVYEQYVDPAAAHGWQNAYDETHELPTIAAGDPAPVRGSHRGPRRARQKPPARPSRRALVAVGALGVSAVALIAGISFSGSSSGGSQDRKGGGVRTAPDEPTDGTGPASSAGPTVPSHVPPARATAGTASAGTSATRGAAAGATEPGGPSVPSSAPSTSPAGSAPAATASGPGNSAGKGHGHGSTKGPK